MLRVRNEIYMQRIFFLVGWGLTALSTQIRSYRTFKVKPYQYYKYYNLIEINSCSKITEKRKKIIIIVNLD